MRDLHACQCIIIICHSIYLKSYCLEILRLSVWVGVLSQHPSNISAVSHTGTDNAIFTILHRKDWSLYRAIWMRRNTGLGVWITISTAVHLRGVLVESHDVRDEQQWTGRFPNVRKEGECHKRGWGVRTCEMNGGGVGSKNWLFRFKWARINSTHMLCCRTHRPWHWVPLPSLPSRLSLPPLTLLSCGPR